MTGLTATGRPRELVPFPVRVLITGAVAIALFEIVFRFACKTLPVVTSMCCFEDGTPGSNRKTIICIYKGEIL